VVGKSKPQTTNHKARKDKMNNNATQISKADNVFITTDYRECEERLNNVHADVVDVNGSIVAVILTWDAGGTNPMGQELFRDIADCEKVDDNGEPKWHPLAWDIAAQLNDNCDTVAINYVDCTLRVYSQGDAECYAEMPYKTDWEGNWDIPRTFRKSQCTADCWGAAVGHVCELENLGELAGPAELVAIRSAYGQIFGPYLAYTEPSLEYHLQDGRRLHIDAEGNYHKVCKYTLDIEQARDLLACMSQDYAMLDGRTGKVAVTIDDGKVISIS